MVQRKGDPTATLNATYHSYARQVFGYIRRRFPGVSAEDVTQETLERLWRIRDAVDFGKPIEPYLFTIAANLARDILRGRRSEAAAPLYLLAPTEENGPEEQALQADDHRIVRTALGALAPEDRDVIYLRYWRQMSCHDVSAHLHVSDTAARARLSRAQRRCGRTFRHLSPVLVPLGAGAHAAFRELRRALGPLGALGTATAVGLAALTVSLTPAITVPAERAPVRSIAVGPSTRVTSTVEIPPRRGGDHALSNASGTDNTMTHDDASSMEAPHTAEPLQGSVGVSPRTGPGPQEEHAFEVTTPVGHVVVEGRRWATGPATVPVTCADLPDRCPPNHKVALGH